MQIIAHTSFPPKNNFIFLKKTDRSAGLRGGGGSAGEEADGLVEATLLPEVEGGGGEVLEGGGEEGEEV